MKTDSQVLWLADRPLYYTSDTGTPEVDFSLPIPVTVLHESEFATLVQELDSERTHIVPKVDHIIHGPILSVCRLFGTESEALEYQASALDLGIQALQNRLRYLRAVKTEIEVEE